MTRRRRHVYATGVICVTVAVALAALVMQRSNPGQFDQQSSAGITQTLKRELPADHPTVRFVDVSTEAGVFFQHFSTKRSSLLPEDMGSGAAWGDYDNDGDLDLFVVNIAGSIVSEKQPRALASGNALFRNRGNGTFEDVGAQAGVDSRVYGMGAQWADYDGDGDLDLYVTCYGPNILYKNRGDGTFQDVTFSAGVGDSSFSSGAAWSDYDCDGDLDLYVANYVDFRFMNRDDVTESSQQYDMVVPITLNPSAYSPQSNRLYRNDGNGTFTDVARTLDVGNPTGRSLSVTFCDFNNDRWPDIYVANDVSANAMYQNIGNGKFVDISASSWAADYRGAMGLAVGDYDNDQDLDFFVTHWTAQENALYSNLAVEFADVDIDSLRFRDVADAVGLGEISLNYIGWGTEFFDFDNDGKLDLLVINGSTFEDSEAKHKLIPQQPMLFWNRGESGFYNVASTAGAPFEVKVVGRGAALADYDNDGDVDIFILVHGGRGKLLRNDGGNRNNWLKVHTVGESPNTQGVGARVRAVIEGRSQIREVGVGNSYLSQNSCEIEFGLAAAEQVDTLEVTWPNGQKSTLINVASNQTVPVREGP